MEPVVIEKLKELVEEVGTQQKAAERLGITQPHLSDVLKGKKNLGPEALRKLGLRKREVYEKIRN